MKTFYYILLSLSLSPLCSVAFPFPLYDDRDPEGYRPPSLSQETSDDLAEETKAKRLEDAQGIKHFVMLTSKAAITCSYLRFANMSFGLLL